MLGPAVRPGPAGCAAGPAVKNKALPDACYLRIKHCVTRSLAAKKRFIKRAVIQQSLKIGNSPSSPEGWHQPSLTPTDRLGSDRVRVIDNSRDKVRWARQPGKRRGSQGAGQMVLKMGSHVVCSLTSDSVLVPETSLYM